MKKMVYMGLILGALTAAGCATVGSSGADFSYKVGQFEVYLLVEAERDGNAGILIGANEEILSRYIPAAGFKHTANAYLIKAAGKNILIDTGTGAGDIIIEKVKSLGVKPENVNAVIITHLHGDHFGSLQRDGNAVFPNATVYLSEKELQYFTVTNVNENAVNALAPYKEKTVTFTPGELGSNALSEILPGITPIAAYGHTPGHTIFQIQNGNKKLLIISDLLHVALVQFPIPEISATYDVDPAAAAKIRRQVLAYAAENKIPVAGMHIVNPGMGNVEVDGEGFKFIPLK